MAITELVFPVVKTDKASIEELERDFPIFAKKLTDPNPGFLNAFRGWVLSEDDRNVRDEYREILILEWKDEASFNAFLLSNQYAAFAGTIKHLLMGKPVLQLYDTNTSPKDVAIAPVVEVVRVTIKNPESSKAAQQVWEKMSQFLIDGQQKRIDVTYGKSLNLECCVIVGMLGWPSLEQRYTVSKGTTFTKGLASLRSLGDVSQIIVAVDPLALPPL